VLCNHLFVTGFQAGHTIRSTRGFPEKPGIRQCVAQKTETPTRSTPQSERSTASTVCRQAAAATPSPPFVGKRQSARQSNEPPVAMRATWIISTDLHAIVLRRAGSDRILCLDAQEDRPLPAEIKNAERLGYLDSVRGIAALVVVLCHCWLLNSNAFMDAHVGLVNGLSSISNLFFYCLSRLKEAGHSAVIVFFVLSGFVLAYSLQKNPTPYSRYLIKRTFRLYPAFLFAIFISYVLHSIIGAQHESASEWFRAEVLNPDMTLETLLKHFAAWGTVESHGLNIAIWSLVHEMRISLIFPIILFSVVRHGWRSILIWWLVSVFFTLLTFFQTGIVIEGTDVHTFGRTFFDSAYFVVFFAVGAFLAIERERVASRMGALPIWMRVFLFVIVAYLLLKTDYSDHTLAGGANDYMRGLGAVGLIALALGITTFRAVLYRRSLLWLGRVSYSLYLVHIPILYVITQTIGQSWSVVQTSIVVIPLSLVAAELMARAIEFPSVELGKKLSARLPVAGAKEGPPSGLPEH
jgi:peptidoglycan/LPS O-acetylase OafA/YrhL